MTEPDLDDLYAGLPDPPTEASARALRVAETWLGEGVHGVALGETSEGEPCVVVHADTDVPVDRIPTVCEGLPVRVERTGEFRAGG